MTRLDVAISLSTAPPALAGALVPGARSGDVLELRADLVGDVDPAWLRDRFPGRLLYALRSAAAGGRSVVAADERRRRLIAAAGVFDLVDLEPADVAAGISEGIPPARRWISWHGAPADLPALRRGFAALASIPAALRRVIVDADGPLTALSSVRLLAEVGRPDLVAHANGPFGLFTRPLAPRFGAPLAFAAEPWEMAMEGSLEIGEVAARPIDHLHGITGPRVARSRSPALHHRRLRARGIPAIFVPLPAATLGAILGPDFLAGLDALRLPLRGLTVAAPFKEEALARAAAASPLARAAFAANLLVRGPTGWSADTTDGEGVRGPLRARGFEIAGRRVAVIGCGGAGRAAAIELRRAGAVVTLINRSEARGRAIAGRLGLPFAPLAGLSLRGFDVVIHATPGADELAYLAEAMPRSAVLVDYVYGASEAALAARAAARGVAVIDGEEVLEVEVREQFSRMNPSTTGASDG